MRWVLKCLLTVLSLQFLVFSSIYAASDFGVNIVGSYEISQNSNAFINYDVKLSNLNTEKYATSFSFTVRQLDINNLTTTDSTGRELENSILNQSGNSVVTVFFDEPVFGKGKFQEFTISFQNDKLVEKKGDVWDIHIPKIDTSTDISSFVTKVYVPNNFGDLAFISQRHSSYESSKNHKIYTFNNLATKSSINLAFGRFQVYKFKLNYHLENPLNQQTSINIAIPPDTHFQKVLLGNLDPKPASIKKDVDGNWLATYVLNERQKLNVVAEGFIQVFSVSVLAGNDEEEYLKSLTNPTKHWQADNAQIKSTANSLRTANNIYNFVVDNLTYVEEPSLRPAVRKGALGALNQPDASKCTEFTDLFIALTRASGIPSREINGYAVSTDPDLQPVGLVQDVLHSWPEYWDDGLKIWRPVDPTWEKTSGGQDYFNSFDLNHITFAIHGQNSQTPIAAGTYKFGADPGQDVFIELAQLPNDTKANFDIQILPKPSGIFQKRYEINITNKGPSAAYNENVEIFFDDILQKEIQLISLLPYESTKIEIKTGIGLFAKNMPGKIGVNINGDSQETTTNKQSLKVAYIIGTFIVLFSATAVLFVEIYKIRK